MPFRLDPTLRDRLAGTARPLVGMWVCSGSPLVAEICAGSGLDWVLLDAEHSPNGLTSLLAQLQAVHGHGATPVVRPPSADPVLLKQYLDLGVQNLLLPMIDTPDQAARAVQAVRYPPAGIRGVGSALARASRWNRVGDYLDGAQDSVSLVVQVESATAVEHVEEIATTDGVDGVFVGPADLAASMGLLGRPDHPDVVAAVEHCLAVGARVGTPVGVNAFAPPLARRYLAAGARFVLVGADVTLLARGSELLAATYHPGSPDA